VLKYSFISLCLGDFSDGFYSFLDFLLLLVISIFFIFMTCISRAGFGNLWLVPVEAAA